MNELEKEIQELREAEYQKYVEADKNQELYIMKEYEILEWEIREVIENEGVLVRENPLDFPPAVQRKYFWASDEDWKFPDSVDFESEDWVTPEGKYIHTYTVVNPYTKEERHIYELRDVYVPPPPSNQEIGDKILQDVFEGNPYAQLADLTKSQVITLAILVPILGKETVRAAYSDLIATLEKVSQARVENWLSPFDLSFLD